MSRKVGEGGNLATPQRVTAHRGARPEDWPRARMLLLAAALVERADAWREELAWIDQALGLVPTTPAHIDYRSTDYGRIRRDTRDHR